MQTLKVGLLLSSLPYAVSSPKREKKYIKWKVIWILPLLGLKCSLVSHLYQGHSQSPHNGSAQCSFPLSPDISMTSATLFFAYVSTSTLASMLSFQRKTQFYVPWFLLCLESSSPDAYMVYILAPPSLCSHPL